MLLNEAFRNVGMMESASAGLLGNSAVAEMMESASAGLLGNSAVAEMMESAITLLGKSELAAAMRSAERELSVQVNSAETDSSVPTDVHPLISRREIAVYLTVAMFLLVYTSLSVAISKDPRLAAVAHEDGPTPFEAAMAVGALTFWTVLSWTRDD